MSDTIIVYVTRTGNARSLAKELGAKTGYPVFEVVDQVRRKGFFAFMKAGEQAVRRKASPIGDPGAPLAGVKHVVFVQPIWASNLCPPLRSWMQAHAGELAGVQYSVLATSQGVPQERYWANIESDLGKLKAYASVLEKLEPAAKSALVSEFAAKLR